MELSSRKLSKYTEQVLLVLQCLMRYMSSLNLTNLRQVHESFDELHIVLLLQIAMEEISKYLGAYTFL